MFSNLAVKVNKRLAESHPVRAVVLFVANILRIGPGDSYIFKSVRSKLPTGNRINRYNYRGRWQELGDTQLGQPPVR